MSFRVAMCLAALGLLAAGAASAQEQGPVIRRAPAETDRVIIQFKPALDNGRMRIQSAEDRVQALAKRHGMGLRGIRSLAPDLAVLAVEADGTSLADRLRALKNDPAVEFAEPDHRRTAHAVPSDPLYTDQWYHQAVEPAATHMETAWDTTTGTSDTVIAVLDTGIRYEHPDLKRESEGGRLLPGYDFVGGESSSSFLAANDGDGWDDDPSDPGDWLGPSDLLQPAFAGCGDVADSSWHGTRVAGMIGALSNNGAGVTGGDWNARILPVRVLGKCGGYDSDIIAAMRWAAGLPVSGVPANPTPANILNLSLGGVTSCASTYRNLITELTAAGVLVVASAGNETGPVDSPGNCPGVLAVAGVRHVGTKVGYSSYGEQISVAAPAGNCVNVTGECLFSLVTTNNSGVTNPDTSPGGSTYTNSFNYNVGTSFAAPQVAAIAGLMHAANDSLEPAEYIERIKASARSFPSDPALPTCPTVSGSADSAGQCNCTTSTCGAGIADAAAAVAAALPPLARIAVGPVARGQSVTLDGGASRPSNSRSISSYQWTIITGEATIANPTAAIASVVAPTTGPLSVRLTVTDDSGAQDSAESQVTADGGSSGGGGGGGGSLDVLALLGLAVAGFSRRGRRTAQR